MISLFIDNTFVNSGHAFEFGHRLLPIIPNSKQWVGNERKSLGYIPENFWKYLYVLYLDIKIFPKIDLLIPRDEVIS